VADRIRHRRLRDDARGLRATDAVLQPLKPLQIVISAISGRSSGSIGRGTGFAGTTGGRA
jgi:hypothetical protein